MTRRFAPSACWGTAAVICRQCGGLLHDEITLIANAFMRPALTYGATVGALLNCTSMRPAIMSAWKSPPPLYGTCRISMPAIILKISTDRCDTEPTPLADVGPPLPPLTLSDSSINHSMIANPNTVTLHSSTGPDQTGKEPVGQALLDPNPVGSRPQ